MKWITPRTLLITVALALAGCAAFAQAPVISWTDAAGSHSAQLTLQYNDDWNPMNPPYNNVDPVFYWVTDVFVTMDDAYNVVKLECSGNFWGGMFNYKDSTYYEGVWNMVRINQKVLNASSGTWDSFYLELSDRVENDNPAPNAVAAFGNNISVDPLGAWLQDPDLDGSDNLIGIYPDDPDALAPGAQDGFDYTLKDEFKMWADVDMTTGQGGFYLYKSYNAPVPEPGSMAVLAGGLGGLAIFARRRTHK